MFIFNWEDLAKTALVTFDAINQHYSLLRIE